MTDTDGPGWGSGRAGRGRVSRRDIVRFTEITGDRNPIHYDPEAAKRRTRFGEVVVQGGVTSGHPQRRRRAGAARTGNGLPERQLELHGARPPRC